MEMPKVGGSLSGLLSKYQQVGIYQPEGVNNDLNKATHCTSHSNILC